MPWSTHQAGPRVLRRRAVPVSSCGWVGGSGRDRVRSQTTVQGRRDRVHSDVQGAVVRLGGQHGGARARAAPRDEDAVVAASSKESIRGWRGELVRNVRRGCGAQGQRSIDLGHTRARAPGANIIAETHGSRCARVYRPRVVLALALHCAPPAAKSGARRARHG